MEVDFIFVDYDRFCRVGGDILTPAVGFVGLGRLVTAPWGRVGLRSQHSVRLSQSQNGFRIDRLSVIEPITFGLRDFST